MNIKINYHYLYILIFASFFFFWGVNLNLVRDLTFLDFDSKNRDLLSNFRLSRLIVILIIPILYSLIKKNISSFKQIFNYQKYIMFFILFVVAHYFFVKFYYNDSISKSEIFNLFYLLLLSVIYCHYRNFIQVNFAKIITCYLIIFFTFSIYVGSQIYNVGQCNIDLYIITVIRKYLKISLSNSIYLENSHLAMMTIAVFFSSLFILLKEKKINILFLLLFSIEVIIVLNNLSTTYFVGYFFVQVFLLLFLFKKVNIKYWIITIFFLLLNSYLFFSDKNCTTKITALKVKDIVENNLQKKDSNVTTLIYRRSIIVAKDTLLHHSLGWGIDGMDNATNNLIQDYLDCDERAHNFNLTGKDNIVKGCNHRIPDNVGGYLDENATYWPSKLLNLKDGLSNLFKLFTEFGIFAFIIYFYFLKYTLNIKNINSYNLFIIALFITISIRGAGYFNGGFIFCILEFFYYQKSIQKLKY